MWLCVVCAGADPSRWLLQRGGWLTPTLVVQVGFMQPHSRELIPLTFDSVQDRWQCPQVGAYSPWDGLRCEGILAQTCSCDPCRGGWQTQEARLSGPCPGLCLRAESALTSYEVPVQCLSPLRLFALPSQGYSALSVD